MHMSEPSIPWAVRPRQQADVSLACTDPASVIPRSFLGHSIYSSKSPLDSLYQLTLDPTSFLLIPKRSM